MRRDIDGLAGRPLARPEVTQLARRIEEEQPDVVVAVRIVARPADEARVIFLVARISDDAGLGSNINARYTVESVEIEGLKEHEISAALRDRLQALVGTRLDPAAADQLVEDLKAERPGYDVTRRIERGTRRGQIRVVFKFSETEALRWIPFAKSRSKFVYHSDEGWSGLHDIPIGRRDHRVTVGFALDDNDTLVEEYSGVRLRFETRDIGTERVAASLEASWLNNTWRAPTLAALEAEPARPRALSPADHGGAVADGGADPPRPCQRRRQPVEPRVAAPVTGRTDGERRDRVARLQPAVEPRPAHLADGRGRLRTAGVGRRARQRLRLHRGTSGGRATSSPTATTRIIAEVFGGGITGQAPLFERFTLGDSATLRGWNKFELAPIGGNRVFHQSLEYRFHGAALFLDAGSVWDDGAAHKLRASTGFGFHTEHVFLTVAFPLDAPGADAAFMMGVRF